MVIGIEGPAGAGKTTMARTVAPEIGAVVLEGGAWYRALTYSAQHKGVDLDDAEAVKRCAEELRFDVMADAANGDTRLLLDGKDVTETLYDEAVSVAVPLAARHLPAREVIDRHLRATVDAHVTEGVIFVGRHLTRMFPTAAVLRLRIDEGEAERRHAGRSGVAARAVAGRNRDDQEIAKLLGSDRAAGQEVDVTGLSPDEQADLLREFIATVACT